MRQKRVLKNKQRENPVFNFPLHYVLTPANRDTRNEIEMRKMR